MILGAVGGTAYNIMLVLHLVAVVVALVPAVAHPLLARQAERLNPAAGRTLYGFMALNSQRIYGSALILAGVFGFGLSGMSDGVYKLSQGWLVASIILWIAMVGVLHSLVVPAERALGDGDTSAEGKLTVGGSVLTVLALVLFYLMVFKPGL